MGSGILVANNDIKDIIKVNKSSQNRGILLKRAAEKIISEEGGLLSKFFCSIKESWFIINTLATEILKWSFLKYGGQTTHGPINQNFSLIE